MGTKTKISLSYGYRFTIDEDDTLTLKIETADGILELEGKKGYLYFWSECVDEEDIDASPKLTFEQMLYGARECLKDWDVDEETAEAIICDLTPWFNKFAISEAESVATKIEELESWIKGRRETIASCVKSIDRCRHEISVYEERIGYEVSQILRLNEDIEDITKRIAELKASLKNEKFISVDPEYTGGGIYLFTGRLTDGNYFMADTANYDVRVLNADPNEPTGMDALGITERNIDSVEWQEEHLVKDLAPDEAVAFFKEMLGWVKRNDPDGNYLGSDMDYFMNELENLHGDWR